MIFEPEFWGSEGRVARITAGTYVVHFALVFWDPNPEAWAVVVMPAVDSPAVDDELDVLGEHGPFMSEELAVEIIDDGRFEWLPLGPQEAALERDVFSYRPLNRDIEDSQGPSGRYERGSTSN
jgi:hypothetical protein